MIVFIVFEKVKPEQYCWAFKSRRNLYNWSLIRRLDNGVIFVWFVQVWNYVRESNICLDFDGFL